MKDKNLKKLAFGPGKENSGKDFILKSHNFKGIKKKIDVLIFADSRGVSLKGRRRSWALQLFDSLKRKGLSVVLVVRPKNCTTFLTLLNFLKLNGLRSDHLVTQVGFVDFTPKKKEIIEDILEQKDISFNKSKFDVKKLKKYRLSGGKEEYLYSIDFDKKVFKTEITRAIRRYFKYAILVGTLEVGPKIKLERKRPVEFYKRLKTSNKFLADLSQLGDNTRYVQPWKTSLYKRNAYTYDGVHYTESGHRCVYNAVRGILERDE